ncbi:MAG: hypothetical protein N3B18_09305 [Desulfobacterota bacterium]|nr:hypothetical protein [Thermodesulfobacteriota bacterium]
MKNKFLKSLIGLTVLAAGVLFFHPTIWGQTTHDAFLDTIFIFPGDARSIEYTFDAAFPDPESSHIALIAAFAPDFEIHQLSINISPRGDIGPELGYVTGGVFFCFTNGMFNFVEVLDPKFTYGFNSTHYLVNVNPYFSLGILISTATTKFSHVDFPVPMTLTITLSP